MLSFSRRRCTGLPAIIAELMAPMDTPQRENFKRISLLHI
jgi:hypothetical protein